MSEVKSDGRYVDIIVRPDSVTYMSRAGHVVDFNSPERDTALMQNAECEGAYVLMGETLVSDGNGGVLPRAEGNGYLNNDDIDKTLLRFVVWDLVSLDQFNAKFCPFSRIDRIDNVSELVKNLELSGCQDISLVEYRICNTHQDALDHFEAVVKAGGEGVVLKNFKGVWKDGTSADQIKLKIIVEGELAVVGMTEGEGRLKGMCGALICQSSCGLVAVNVAGLSDKLRKEFFDNPDTIVGRIITLKYNDVVYSETTGLWSLYLPRFVEKRSDKFDADDKEKLIEQMKSAIDGIKLF
jgi:DNA ligase-1